MTTLSLNFIGNESPELFESVFAHNLLNEERRCIRGKSAGAYEGWSTFQWTKAVRAFALLVVNAKIQELLNDAGQGCVGPNISGYAQSLAASLDYAIDKQTTWLLDMLGWDKNGLAHAKRAIHRTNPNRKRSGPVALSLNTKFLSAKDVHIYLDGKEVVDTSGLRALAYKIDEDAKEMKAHAQCVMPLRLAGVEGRPARGIASRMESASQPNQIHVSKAVQVRLADDYAFDPRGMVELKGKGQFETYFLLNRKEGH